MKDHEKEFDEHAQDLLFLLRRFGGNRAMTDRQTIALTLWVTAIAIKEDVKINGPDAANNFKRGLLSTIQEIDEIVRKDK